ncbi:uncharacterized protein (DUF1684 family) [Streptomyces sp. V4I23]|nr:uncharacterized protein (DUF1684 family) [Streptomyces sp. V4I23]
MPGTWPEDGDEVVLTATAEDALTVDGQPFTGSVRLAADHAPIPGSRVAHVTGVWSSCAAKGLGPYGTSTRTRPPRTAFRGIEATAYDPRWVLPGRFRPYEEHTGVRVEVICPFSPPGTPCPWRSRPVSGTSRAADPS